MLTFCGSFRQIQVVLEANFDCFADRVDQHLGRVQLRLAFPAYAEKANEIAPKQVHEGSDY